MFQAVTAPARGRPRLVVVGPTRGRAGCSPGRSGQLACQRPPTIEPEHRPWFRVRHACPVRVLTRTDLDISPGQKRKTPVAGVIRYPAIFCLQNPTKWLVGAVCICSRLCTRLLTKPADALLTPRNSSLGHVHFGEAGAVPGPGSHAGFVTMWGSGPVPPTAENNLPTEGELVPTARLRLQGTGNPLSRAVPRWRGRTRQRGRGYPRGRW